MRPGLIIAAAALGATLLSTGVAYADPLPAAGRPPPEDPYEAMNRRFYASHNGLDRTIFLPLAKLYRALTPGFIGEAIHNALTNLHEPVIVANDILQGRLGHAAEGVWRLAANSTVGLGGMIDVAAKAGYPHHDNDFGITLGVWGVKPGPYLFVPVLGPTTVRDTVGEIGDIFLNPMLYVRFPGHQTLEITTPIVSGLDTRYRAEPELEAVLSEATDPYATLRSVYLQNRGAMVRGENATPALPPMDELPSAPSTAPAQPDQSAPSTDGSAPGPTSKNVAPAQGNAPASNLAEASLDPDAPMATARPFDLSGGPDAARGA
ncbi:MAG TPA: MlaA family lipoprotein [Caulobacteraceae bacterium]|nr:MlaA family lipoprotein [Caulobacteraceae bacterium]